MRFLPGEGHDPELQTLREIHDKMREKLAKTLREHSPVSCFRFPASENRKTYFLSLKSPSLQLLTKYLTNVMLQVLSKGLLTPSSLLLTTKRTIWPKEVVSESQPKLRTVTFLS